MWLHFDPTIIPVWSFKDRVQALELENWLPQNHQNLSCKILSVEALRMMVYVTSSSEFNWRGLYVSVSHAVFKTKEILKMKRKAFILLLIKRQ